MHLSGFPVCLSSVFTGESRAAQDEQTASRPLASVLLKGPLKAFCDSVSLSVTLPKEAGPPGAGALGPRGGAGASLEAPGGRAFCIRAPESLSDPRRLPPGPSSPQESRGLASEGHLRRASWSLAAGWPPTGTQAVPAASLPLSHHGAQRPSGWGRSLQTSLG